MTRAHCTRQLLRHGPLTFRDYWQITGWPYEACRDTISYLQELGEIKWDGAWRLV